jgi:hypothetical protein
LHHQEHADQKKIGEIVTRNLLARIAGNLPELGQLLPDESNRSQCLEREQCQIGARLSFGVVRFHSVTISARSSPV